MRSVPGEIRSGLVLLLCGVTVGATLAGPWQPPLNQHRSVPWTFGPLAGPPPVLTPAVDPPPPPPAAPVVPGSAPWLVPAVLLVTLVIATWIGHLVVRRIRRAARLRLTAPALAPRSEPEQVQEPWLHPLREGLARADAAVRGDQPPTDAVIAAWVALEEAAARAGVIRHPTATPTEFTLAVLDHTPADHQATRALLRLYHQARFSDQQLTGTDVTLARAALATIRTGLARERG